MVVFYVSMRVTTVVGQYTNINTYLTVYVYELMKFIQVQLFGITFIIVYVLWHTVQNQKEIDVYL